MAEVTPINGNIAMEPPELVGVTGWDSANFCTGKVPAVVVNPNASAQDLANWAFGNLRQANKLMAVIGCAGPSGVVEDPAELAGAIRHFTDQAQTVLQAAIERMGPK